MRIARVLIAAILTAPIAPALTHAQTIPAPKTLADVPVFAGAKRVPTDTEDFGAEGPMQMLAEFRDLKMHSREVAAYEIGTHPEAVFEFYIQKLGGKVPKELDEVDFTQQKPGTMSDVFLIPTSYDIDAKGGALLAARPKYDGEWLRVALVMWGMREASGNVTSFAVGIADSGVAPNWSSYKPRTRFVIVRVTYFNPPVGGATLSSVMTDAMTTAMKEIKDTLVAATHEMMGSMVRMVGGPTESMLGVPVYTGAKFDMRTSAVTSRQGVTFYSFMSEDEPTTVIDFYRARTQVAPTDLGADGTVFVIDGQLPFPRTAVYVNRNTVTGRHAKTMITIRKGQ